MQIEWASELGFERDSAAPRFGTFGDDVVCAGIVTHARPRIRVAVAANAARVSRSLTFEEQARRSPLNLMAYLGKQVITAFMDDLARYEQDGLLPAHGRAAQEALTHIANALSEFDSPAFFPDQSLFDRFTLIVDCYRGWNVPTARTGGRKSAAVPAEPRALCKRLLR